MVERSWGRIVNIGSDAGRVGSSLESIYSGAKGGVIAFTKTIAREFARYGITANTVCPGPTEAAGIVYNIVDCEKPVISAINGVAVGAGLAVAPVGPADPVSGSQADAAPRGAMSGIPSAAGCCYRSGSAHK
jgi:NAD(P)-dependent dehydrogenase (short-subunit alcohol dehydrogenase family)